MMQLAALVLGILPQLLAPAPTDQPLASIAEPAGKAWKVTNFGIDALIVDEDGGRLLVQVSEFSLDQDLNGDGDKNDRVYHLLDLSNGELTNLAHASANASACVGILRGPSLAVLCDETRQGEDLNADGDESDEKVLVLLDDEGNRLTPHGWAVYGPPLSRPRLEFDGRRAAVAVSEADHGPTDLNGDGDMFDVVPVVEDIVAGTSFLTGLAIERDVGSFRLVGDRLFFLVDARSQGSGTFDRIAHVANLENFGIRNLGAIAVVNVFDVPRLHPLEGGKVAFVAQPDGVSSSSGFPTVVHLEHGDSETVDIKLTNDFRGGMKGGGRLLAVAVDESIEDQDLDGNGEVDDVILHVYDCATHELLNLAVGIDLSGASDGLTASVDDRIVFRSLEELEQLETRRGLFVYRPGEGIRELFADVERSLQVERDWVTFRQRDTDDVFVARVSDGALFPVPLASDEELLHESGVVALETSDGLHLFEPQRGILWDLELFGQAASWTSEGLVVLASEPSQGEDLNGDGDAFDSSVIHLVEPALQPVLRERRGARGSRTRRLSSAAGPAGSRGTGGPT